MASTNRGHDQDRDEQHLREEADEPRFHRIGRHAIGDLLDRPARNEQHESREQDRAGLMRTSVPVSRATG